MSVERTCATCGKTFHIPEHRARDGRGTYCSWECRSTSREVTCLTCGKSFRIKPNAIRAGGNYCSRRCHYQSHGRRPFKNEDGTWSIPLTRGKVAVVDADDLPLVQGISWQAVPHRRTYYAKGLVQGRDLTMHQVLMPLRDGLITDHVDGNGLNNRRSNLRRVTHTENQINRRRQRNNTTGYKGVSESNGRFTARVANRHVGTFATAEEAARAYDAAAVALFGDIARPNFTQSRENQ